MEEVSSLLLVPFFHKLRLFLSPGWYSLIVVITVGQHGFTQFLRSYNVDPSAIPLGIPSAAPSLAPSTTTPSTSAAPTTASAPTSATPSISAAPTVSSTPSGKP
eukprot:scaffold41932_cov48-Attheya_sp.AAC.1